MARPDDQGPGALRQLVVGVQPPEDDALEYVVHGFEEGISNPGKRRDRRESAGAIANRGCFSPHRNRTFDRVDRVSAWMCSCGRAGCASRHMATTSSVTSWSASGAAARRARRVQVDCDSHLALRHLLRGVGRRSLFELWVEMSDPTAPVNDHDETTTLLIR